MGCSAYGECMLYVCADGRLWSIGRFWCYSGFSRVSVSPLCYHMLTFPPRNYSVQGWDPVTGLGTPNFPKLLARWLLLP